MKIVKKDFKWKGKLSLQLGCFILVVNLLVLVLGFSLMFMQINALLLKKNEDANIKRFEQSEYNLKVLYEEINQITRRLTEDVNLKRLADSHALSESDRMYYVIQTISSMDDIYYNYSYFENISYYGEDGLVIKNMHGEHNRNYYLQDSKEQEPYYATDIYRQMKNNMGYVKLFGGYTLSDFCDSCVEDNQDMYYITIARKVLFGAGTVIFNIDMKYFLDTFYVSDIHTDTTEKTYVVDEENRIVAAKDLEMVGLHKNLQETDKSYDDICRYIEDGKDGKKQMMIYPLLTTGWKLVNEKSVLEVTADSRYLRRILWVTCMLSAVLSFTLSMWWVSKLLKPLNRLDEEIKKIGYGKLGSIVENPPNNELGGIIKHFNKMSLELESMFQQNEKIEQEKREYEMRVLRAQINPHLIYNVLNTIKWRAIFCNERNIAESVSLLADFLQPVFKNQKLTCTVGEELNYVKNYIRIMNLLRTNEFILENMVPEEYNDYPIIRFLLQPVVENSILHGYSQEVAGVIRICMKVEGEIIFVQVEDDGCGIENSELETMQRKLKENSSFEKDQGIGILNVNRRIKNQYGEECGVEIYNRSERGTRVVLKIRHEKKEVN